ncbi:MAG: hypothetical protein HGA85_07220 [Nanoarchaeota archaeon]|nr:hypothetical protein [Nanoarchaeota archaeon]
MKDIRLTTSNDQEINIDSEKSMFGTSAAATISTIAAILKLHEVDDRDLIYKLARYSHYKTHGEPSDGYDLSCTCYGSQFFLSDSFGQIASINDAVKSRTDVLKEPYDWTDMLNPVFILMGKGTPPERLIKKVLAWKKAKPERYLSLMRDYNVENLRLKTAFEENSLEKVKYHLERSWYIRRELGTLSGAEIEPERLTRMIYEFKAKGAFIAGLVGYGGGDLMVAFTRTSQERAALIGYLEDKNYSVLERVGLATKPFEYV